MDHNATEETDLERGGTGHEDETGKGTISGNNRAKHMLGRLRSGLLGYNGSLDGQCVSTYSSGTSSEDPHDNIELVIDKNSGQKVELVPLLEKKRVKEKRKTSSKKAPKPPRPPKGPTLDNSDLKLVMEISELSMKKRARVQRIKALKKMKAEKSLSPSSSSNSSLAAMAFTLLFCFVIVFQGVYSRTSSSTGFQGSPEPATTTNGLISIQLYKSTPASEHIELSSVIPNSVENITDLESRPQDKALV